MGFGFRGDSPPWPYVGRGRGGLPRCGYFAGGTEASWPYNPYTYQGVPAAGVYPPYSPRISRDEELNYLKSRAEALRDELKELEAEIGKLSADKE
jgi:hypothetical protein